MTTVEFEMEHGFRLPPSEPTEFFVQSLWGGKVAADAPDALRVTWRADALGTRAAAEIPEGQDVAHVAVAVDFVARTLRSGSAGVERVLPAGDSRADNATCALRKFRGTTIAAVAAHESVEGHHPGPPIHRDLAAHRPVTPRPTPTRSQALSRP